MSNLKDLNTVYYEEIRDCIKKGDDFLITTHINPDGDSISSILLLSIILDHLDKNYIIVIDKPLPEKFNFLPFIENISIYNDIAEGFTCENFVALDASDLNRLGRLKGIAEKSKNVINIDHHPSNVLYGDINLVESDKSSAVEIVYKLFQLFNIPLSKEIAIIVYTGIMCDTGRFLFPNTNYNSLKISAEMVKAGAQPNYIGKKIYYRISKETMFTLSNALSTLEFNFENKVSSIYLLNNDLYNNENLDTEGFVDYLMKIDGTEVQIFLHEVKADLFKVSFRSNSYIDVNKVAGYFNGGGHLRASGCYISGNIQNVKNRILKVIEEYI